MLLTFANIFQPLIDVFEAVLKFFHNDIGVSWGWSIVLLTISARLVLLPLAVKQFHSMQKLQRVAPQLKEIQNRYKDDKQRQQQEVMKFYKENEVNPFASCLPLVAQIPVFIGLFYMLRTTLRPDICPGVQAAYRNFLVSQHHLTVAAAHGQTTYCTNPQFADIYHAGPQGAGFLFIPDLTNKASGAVLVTLLILYVGTQLASSLMMATPTMDKNQRRIMLLLPLFFVVIVINFPAGLLVYWITTNLWTMSQQYVIRRRLGPATPPASPAAANGGRPAATVTNGAGSDSGSGTSSGTGGIAGLLGRLRPPDGDKEGDKAKAGVGSKPRRDAPPPPPPRKKKKRSGRRR
ncbi:MAG TPA: YidC/Oxa1 family membrane protein insertase [Solirubrobacteraceae bacterium]|jgi:YidC/Oxa1 family membrane protein insertase